MEIERYSTHFGSTFRPCSGDIQSVFWSHIQAVSESKRERVFEGYIQSVFWDH